MERNAHFALVGALSVALMVGLAAFAVWLAGVQFSQRYDEYDVAFTGPVRGLSSGGSVYFNGIKVGEVVGLTLDRTDPNRVRAHIRVTSDSPVRTDSRASLEPQGVTGVNYIQISAGTASKPLLKAVTGSDQTPTIPASRSALDTLFEGGGNVLVRAVDALDRVNRLLSDRNLHEMSGALADLHSVTSELRSQRQLIADLDATVRSANATSVRVGALAEDSRVLVNGEGRRTLANLADAAAELKATAADTRAAISHIAPATADFTASGLPQLNRAVTSLQATAESLDRLVSDIERNPSGVLTKGPARTVEIKP